MRRCGMTFRVVRQEFPNAGQAQIEKILRSRWMIQAQQQLNAALRKGVIARGPCFLAGRGCYGRMEAHHWDYTKPLDVTWTCHRHHHYLDLVRRDQERFHAAT